MNVVRLQLFLVNTQLWSNSGYITVIYFYIFCDVCCRSHGWSRRGWHCDRDTQKVQSSTRRSSSHSWRPWVMGKVGVLYRIFYRRLLSVTLPTPKQLVKNYSDNMVFFLIVVDQYILQRPIFGIFNLSVLTGNYYNFFLSDKWKEQQHLCCLNL